MRKHTNRGFTAVEMMVALALVSIIVGIGLVNYTRQIPRYELREAGRSLAGRLRLLRQKAIAEGGTRELSFEPDDGSYEFEGLDGEDLPSHIRFGIMEGVTENTYGEGSLPDDGVSFDDDTASFQADGLPVGPGAIYMTNDPFRSEAIAITVNITGRVRLFEWNSVDGQWQ